MVLAAVIPFNFEFVASDTARRLMAGVILLVIYGLARERRQDHGWEFPGDSYSVLETTAWVGLYPMANLKLSPWLSFPDGVPQFYWATYAAIWVLPAVGLFLAIRDRHRWMLDANIVLAIVTVMSNKPYLGAEQGVGSDPVRHVDDCNRARLEAMALERSGRIEARLHCGAAARLGARAARRRRQRGRAGPRGPTPHSHPAPELGSGGRSGGAGASGEF